MPEDIDNDGKEEEEREVWSEVLVKMVGRDCTRIAFTRLMENNSEALYLGLAFTEERPPIECGEPS